MSGGIALLLLVLIAVAVGVWFFVLGGASAVRAFRDARAPSGRRERPTHRVAEPVDENAAGYGVSGEHADDPRPPRVPRAGDGG